MNDEENEPTVGCQQSQASAADTDDSLEVTLRNVCEILKLVTEALSIRRRDSTNIQKLPSSGASIKSPSEAPCVTDLGKIVADGVILKQLPDSTPGKQGISLLKHLFRLDEQIKGIEQPKNDS